MNNTLPPVLLVEDNPDDAELTLAAFDEADQHADFVVARDGGEAMDWLNCVGAYARRKPCDLPCLILLDLKLPRVSGFELLRYIRAEQRLRDVPVVVLSSSDEMRDVEESYRLGANSYVQKTVSFAEFRETARRLGSYWLNANKSHVCPAP